MKLSLLDLSKHEHQLVEMTPSEFGPEFVNAYDLVFFIWSFISSVKPEAYTFSLFLSQIQKWARGRPLKYAFHQKSAQYHILINPLAEVERPLEN